MEKLRSVNLKFASMWLMILFVVVALLHGCGPIATTIDYAIYRSELPDVDKRERITMRAVIDSKSDIGTIKGFDYKFTTIDSRSGKLAFHKALETVKVGELVEKSLKTGLERLFVVPKEFQGDEANYVNIVFRIENIRADTKWKYSVSGSRGNKVEVDTYDITTTIAVRYECKLPDGHVLSSGIATESARTYSTDLEGGFFARTVRKTSARISSAIINQLKESISLRQYAQTVMQQRELPCSFDTSVSYTDTTSFIPNNTIDAGEQSTISATITNKGKGTAFDVKLNTDCDFPCVDFDKVINIGDIPPGESKKMKVKLYGRLDLKNGTAPFLLQCKEKRGFDSKKVKLNIPTAHLEKPDIFIADYKINDGNTGLAGGNGNGIPENGETIELTAFVKNNGVGRAIKVDLGIASINSGVEVTRKQTEIAQILPGQTMSGKLAFAIPRTYSGGDIRVALKASDVRGASDGVKQLALNVNTIGPVLAYSYNITDRNGNGFVENGETCELEIRVANKGQMEARAVSINVDSAYLSFSRNRTELGQLETGSANMPARFSFTVPRTLEKKSVDVEVQLTQAEFPGLTENINVPIKVSRPEFAISHQILDPNGNSVIEQGESVELVVRVKNTGQLDAADVNLSINIDQKGIILTSAKEFSIGRIQAGRESDPIRFMITVQRSVPAGDLPVSFNITQKDFKSRNLVLALNVAPEKAKEITVAGQRPESGYRPVSQAGRFKMAPHVVITTPRDGKRVVTNTIDLRGIAADDRGVVSIDINVNGRRIDLHDRGIAVKGDNTQREFYAAVPLRTGRNEIVVTALDNENLASEPKTITVFYEKEKGEVWAAVIGINNYHHVQKLDYARNDASAFADYLRTNLDIQADHLFELYDGQATNRNIQSLLGTQIKSKAGREDTVIIFFAGHGAPEESETSLDGDGIEKYILPCDANTSDLYTTAIPMDEIARIFRRIKAERVILLADCCYSGQTGGRTILSKTRANISDAFLDRLSRGKGRIIITASSASEVSKESDDLKHGYFTYYLLKGLKGAADVDEDGFIDVNEISSYLNREVPEATDQKQHPVKKGEAEGQVVIGRVR